MLGIAVSVISVFALAYGFHRKSGDPDPILLVLGKPAYFDFAWHQYLAWIAVTFTASIITVQAVDRQRHLGSYQPKRRLRWPGRRRPPAQDRKPFSSPLSAQYWYEFRNIGPNMLLTGTLLSQLAEVKGAAARADTPKAWADRVTGPLRVTVLDLAGGIERRQRALDAEQDEVRSQIAGLLQGVIEQVDRIALWG